MDDFNRNKKIVQERKHRNEEKRKQFAQKRLETNIVKKIKTTMIGALASFEDGFGHLWGKDIPEDQLDSDELKFSDMWEEIRSEILDKGNLQIRAAKDELSEYETDWNMYQIDFIKKETR